MSRSFYYFLILAFLCLFVAGQIYAGTTGKLAGQVTNSATKEGLPGASVFVEGTTLGAMTDPDGNFIILNVPPGKHTVRASMMGYQDMKLVGVEVRIDLTTTIFFPLEETVIAGEGVTVVAKKEVIRADITSTMTVASTEEIKYLPVEDMGAVLNMQAGVVGGSVRGGRRGEVAYLVDGVSITDPYSGSQAVQIEPDAVQELQVITGTFNAEYGQAMSGIVNMVTKEETGPIHGEVSSYLGDYISTHKETFLGIDDVNPLAIKNFQISAGGGIPGIKRLSFFVSGRYYDNEGYLYGKRIYTPKDSFNTDKWDINRDDIGAGEVFFDKNGNGVYDLGEKFYDYNGNGVYDPPSAGKGDGIPTYGDPFYDLNGNGIYDPSETFTDVNGNGKWDPAEPFTDDDVNGKWDYVDSNGNGKYDPGETCEPFNDMDGDSVYDYVEPFVDLNGDGMYYSGDLYDDFNKNGIFDPGEPFVHIEKTGDGKIVSMNPYKRGSVQGKLTFRISNDIKISYGGVYNLERFKNYDHNYKYNPDGIAKKLSNGYNNNVILTHNLSSKAFYTFSLSNTYYQYEQHVYDKVEDYKYNGNLLGVQKSYCFKTGGYEMWRFKRSTTSWEGKFDITWQATNKHQFKSGVSGKTHTLYYKNYEVISKDPGNVSRYIDPIIAPAIGDNFYEYSRNPIEGAFYIQDKMEFASMIILNAGVRVDYFNSNGDVLTDPTDPDPNNPLIDYDPDPLKFAKRDPWFKKADPEISVSPRFGISYPITDKGVIHLSYGHFLQIPQFEYLYPVPYIKLGGTNRLTGNAGLKSQKTVIYEIGLQQQIGENIGMDITGYYKDIRALLGLRAYETFGGGDTYYQYYNVDYGNVRGVQFALDRRLTNMIAASVDYTYQVAEGNSSDPLTILIDEANNRESVKKLVPLDWDQRHTLNVSFTLSDPKVWGISFIGRGGTGFPYTPSLQGVVAGRNSSTKPPQYSLDMNSYYNLNIGKYGISFFCKVYNLTDRMNENGIYTDTGRATYSLASLYAPNVSAYGVNTLKEFLIRPDWYSEPRQVILGTSVKF